MTREPLRILLVDDHPVVRAGLRAVLESRASSAGVAGATSAVREPPEPGRSRPRTPSRSGNEAVDLTVVAEAAGAAEALAAVERMTANDEGPDVVIMDIELGDGPTGIEATERLGRSHPGLPVLIVSTYGAVSDVQAAVAAGALGYLLKDASPEELRDAVRQAAAGNWILPADLARRALGAGSGREPALSPRETDILEQLALGHTNQQIAAGLFISQATVKTHLHHIFAKLGVGNRTEAVTVARARRLIRG